MNTRRLAVVIICVAATALGGAMVGATSGPDQGGQPEFSADNSNTTALSPFSNQNSTLGNTERVSVSLPFEGACTLAAERSGGYLTLFGIVAAVLAGTAGLRYDWRAALAVLILVATATAGLYTLACVADLDQDASDNTSSPDRGGQLQDDQGTTSGDASDSGDTQSLPSVALIVVFSTFLVGLVGVLYLTERTDGDESPPDDTDEPDATDIARTARQAADELERAADPENGVYRAWAEMTAGLGVEDPETTTPAELADAAIEAGMARDRVEEITALFRHVRYGDGQPTERREQRALRALRQIETDHRPDS